MEIIVEDEKGFVCISVFSILFEKHFSFGLVILGGDYNCVLNPVVDYFLISTIILDRTGSSTIGSSTQSDHSPIFIKISPPYRDPFKRHWQLNPSLLSNDTFYTYLNEQFTRKQKIETVTVTHPWYGKLPKHLSEILLYLLWLKRRGRNWQLSSSLNLN